MIGIYQILNTINNKRYIGSSVDVEKRWNEHKRYLKINKHHSRYFQRAWNKHSENSFQFELIEGVITLEKDYILEREQYWLDYYKSYERDKGYNICEIAGNTLGRECSEETKRKISENHYDCSGENHPNYNKHHSEETKRKISKANKGKQHSEESKQKMSEAKSGEKHPMFGKHHSEESRKKISQNHYDCSGENHPNYNKHPSKETRQKMSDSKKGKYEGGNHPRAKLTWIKVKEIRGKYKLGEYSHNKLAKEYGVAKRAITCILNNLTWKE